jgi:hypothetical protein
VEEKIVFGQEQDPTVTAGWSIAMLVSGASPPRGLSWPVAMAEYPCASGRVTLENWSLGSGLEFGAVIRFSASGGSGERGQFEVDSLRGMRLLRMARRAIHLVFYGPEADTTA